MDVNKLSEHCIDSIRTTPEFTSRIKNADDATRRAVIEGWYHGYRFALQTSGDSELSNTKLPPVNDFTREVLSSQKLKTAVAA